MSTDPPDGLRRQPDAAVFTVHYTNMLNDNPRSARDPKVIFKWFTEAIVAGATFGREAAEKEAARNHPRGPVIDAIKESQEALEGRMYAMNATLTAILAKLDEFE